MSDDGEVKIVINFKGHAAMVGVGKPECDPVLFTARGELREIIHVVPDFLTAAEATWGHSKRYQKTDWKPPEPPKPKQTSSGGRQPVKPAKPKKAEPVQQTMF